MINLANLKGSSKVAHLI